MGRGAVARRLIAGALQAFGKPAISARAQYILCRTTGNSSWRDCIARLREGQGEKSALYFLILKLEQLESLQCRRLVSALLILSFATAILFSGNRDLTDEDLLMIRATSFNDRV